MQSELQESPTTHLPAWRSPAEIVAQVTHVQEIMRAVMRENEHFGKIPGAKKNCLFKSGAEKLSFTFRLFPEFEVTEKAIGDHHREVIVKCVLRDPTGREVGQGVGSCSTMESKYRWRSSADLEATGKPVPKGYWDTKKDDPSKAQALIGGKGFVAKKDDNGAWMIFAKTAGDRVENPDIADVWNTVLKMAKKRAHVDAVITATATSDIFTQDVEDLPNFGTTGQSRRPGDEVFPDSGSGYDSAHPDDLPPEDPEAAALRADIYAIGKSLPAASQERIQSDIDAAGDDLNRLGVILSAVRKAVSPKPPAQN